MTETNQSAFSPAPWSISKKIAFRFFFLLLALLVFPFPIDIIPGVNVLAEYYNQLWIAIVPTVGKALFGIQHEMSAEPTGSGDTTFIYVQQFIILCLATTGSIIWTLTDRKRSSYNNFFLWFSGYIRVYLIFTMWSYGFAKVFLSQFPFPGLQRLVEPVGDCSPMGLAWTFMGYSPAYNAFTGGLEVLAGTLLVFRRTRLLGAFFAMGVMLNVAMMNFCYDIPVKLYSTLLVLMSVFVAAPDVKRILNFFILNKTAEPYQPVKLIQRKKLRTGINIGFHVLLLALFTLSFLESYLGAEGEESPKSPLYGIYDVKTFVRNGDTVPPLTTDSSRWSRLIVEYDNYAFFQNMRKQGFYNSLETDNRKKSGRIMNYNDTNMVFEFTYAKPEKGKLMLKGIAGKKDTLQIEFNKLEADSFLLVKRGFHWVNEYPYNR